MRTLMMSAVLGMSLVLTGCAATGNNGGDYDVVVAPKVPDYKLEVTLARLNEILANAELTEEQRARFHYDRGVRYDSVGLKVLARIDFHQALKIQPNLVDAYNFLGIYYTQEGEYESAYESFDGVLELSPEYDYAYLNRGIALYYGGRERLAEEDMQAFYNRDKADGYRALWLYISQLELDEKEAQAVLKNSRSTLSDNAWSSVLVDYYLGQLTQQQVFDRAKENITGPNEYAERMCEAYFYIAKRKINNQKFEEAAQLLRLTLATNIFDFVEHRYARVELKRLAAEASANEAP